MQCQRSWSAESSTLIYILLKSHPECSLTHGNLRNNCAAKNHILWRHWQKSEYISHISIDRAFHEFFLEININEQRVWREGGAVSGSDKFSTTMPADYADILDHLCPYWPVAIYSCKLHAKEWKCRVPLSNDNSQMTPQTGFKIPNNLKCLPL